MTIVAAEAYNSGGTGGMAVSPLSQLGTAEYWRIAVPSAIGTSLNSAQIGVSRPPSVYPVGTALGTSDGATATTTPYTFAGGTIYGTTILSEPITQALNGPTGTRFITPATVNLPVKSAFGYQLLFNGSNQEVVAPPNPAYDALTSFTMEALVRPRWMSGAPLNDPCIFSFGDAGSQNFSLNMGKGYTVLKASTNSGATSVQKAVIPIFRRNQYYHISVTYNAGVLTYFVDGKLIGTDNIALTAVMGKPFRIGSRAGLGEFWEGSIDEVRIWNAVLPQSVIATWKRREVDVSHPNYINLVGYWRFNDGFPQNAKDDSPQGNTASLTNSPMWIDGSTTAGVIIAPTGTASGSLFTTKIGGGTLNYALIGANGGATAGTVTLDNAGNLSYTPNLNIAQNVQDTILNKVTDNIPVTSTANITVEFSPAITVVPQFVSYNKPTRFTAQSIQGGTSPFTALWTPPAGLVNTNFLQPTATLITGATYTLQMQDGYGFAGAVPVPVQIQPLSLFFSQGITTGTMGMPPTTGLPGLINSGNTVAMRYGIFRKRSPYNLDSTDASISLHVAPAAGGNAQFAYKYDTTFTQQNRIDAAIVINWLNAPLAGGTTQAVVTLFRTGGAPIDAAQVTVTISSNATAPIITSFSPPSGGAGTFVTITGANFINVNNVRFGGVAAQSFVVVSSTTIRATVAAGSSGLVTVSAMAGSGNSPVPFTFVQPPTISIFTPTQGSSGTTVRITGTNFVQPVTVRFGGVVANNVVVTLPTEIFADVGLGATGNVSVTTPGGTVTTATVFTFFGAPNITSIAPTQGTAGDTITVNGNNFLLVDSVRIGTKTLGSGNGAVAQVISPTLMRIFLDTAVLSGAITIYADAGQGTSAQVFTYIPPPKIDSIAPRVGGAGTAVVVNGKNFTQVDSITFAGVRLTNPIITSQTKLTVTMPSGLTNSTSAIVVFTRSGRDSSKTPNLFQYVQSPVITGFTPVAAGAGAWVQITGANFVAVQNVKFGGTNADSIKVVSPFLLLAKVNASGASGKVSIQAAGGTALSTNDFRFVFAPSITSFSPASASSGASVEVFGKEFINVTSVRIGTGTSAVTLANISVASDTRLLAVLPANAQTGLLTVETAQGTATSQTPLQITIPTGPPPFITTYSPPAASIGAEILISGTNFINVSEVSIGGVSAATVRVVSPSQIAVIVPENASSGSIRVTTPNGTAISRGIFQVFNTSVNAGLTPLQRDSTVLVRFYLASGGGWQREESWLTERTVATWAGVTVDSGRVVRLQLANNNVQGALPSFLSELTALKVLDLSNNFMEGAIPSSIATMSALQELRLGGNRFTGALPELSSMASLQVLAVENNRLVGEFPRGLCALPRVREVLLSNNAFSGVIPSCVGNLTNTVRLNLGNNIFSGIIPPEIGSMTALQELTLSGNMLTGVLPNTLGTQATVQVAGNNGGNKNGNATVNAAPNLTLLDVRRNQLSGTLPTSLGFLRSLKTLLIAENQFSGDLPAQLGNCTDLQTLDASNNQLSGALPASFGGLRRLETLLLKSNRLSGALPLEFGRMAALTTLQLDSNALTGLTDSLANIRTLRRLTVNTNQLSRLPRLMGLDSVNVSRNRLQFSALEAVSQTRVFLYTPQDSVLERSDTTVQVFVPLTRSASLGVGRNEYQWYKVLGITSQGTNSQGTTSFLLSGRTDENLVFERFARADTGVYTCYIRNRSYPELTLIRRNVSIHALPPSAPREIVQLLSPPNNAQSIPLTATLRWTTLATVSGYEVQISTNANFTTILWQSSVNLPFASSVAVPPSAGLVALTSYSWRVRAVSEGLAGAWSVGFRFTTLPAGQPLNVETVDMGRVVVNRTSKSAELRLRNLSNVAIQIQSVQVQTAQILNYQTQTAQTLAGAGFFRFLTPPATTRLDLDEEMTLPLVFAPSVVGEYRASVSVTYAPAAGGTPTTLTFPAALIGRGGILVIDSLSFGTVTAGIPRTTALRIRNIGLDSVRVQGLQFSRTNDSTGKNVFRLTEDALGIVIVRPNDSVSVNVSCITQADGGQDSILRGSVTVISSLDTVYQVPLSASIRQPSQNDVTIATVILPEVNNIAPGGLVTLALKISGVTSAKVYTSPSEALADVYSTGNPEFSGEIEFDKNVLALDAGELGVQKASENGAFVRYRIPTTRWNFDAQGNLDAALLKIRCRAVSGNTNTTTLRINRLDWNNKSDLKSGIVLVSTATANFTSAACEAGGMRLTTTAKANALRIASKNPASDEAVVAYTLREDGAVELSVINILGKQVQTIVSNEAASAGEYVKTVRCETLTTGVYFVRLQTRMGVVVQRLDVVR
jgi:Leucine-rich repeat (LRR) protein